VLVSVVLPVYERAPVVGDAVESALNQTYEKLELIVVDGGSSDGTVEVVRSFDDERIELLTRDEPGGVSSARNAGVEAADGRIVAFVDSDDQWHPDKLERQVEAFERDPALGVCYTGLTKDYGEPLTRGGASGRIFDAVRRMAVPTYTSTLAVRRDAFEAVGGFDEALPCFEDWDLCLRLARDYEFRYLDESLVVKGTGGDNISAEPERLATAVERLEAKHDLPVETRARLWNDVGVTHCEAGALREARPHLRRALRIDPVQPNAVAALALSYGGSTRLFDAAMGRVYALERFVDRLGTGSEKTT